MITYDVMSLSNAIYAKEKETTIKTNLSHLVMINVIIMVLHNIYGFSDETIYSNKSSMQQEMVE